MSSVFSPHRAALIGKWAGESSVRMAYPISATSENTLKNLREAVCRWHLPSQSSIYWKHWAVRSARKTIRSGSRRNRNLPS